MQKMRNFVRLIAITSFLMLVFVVSAASSTVNVYYFVEPPELPSEVNGASSTIYRDNDSASATFHTWDSPGTYTVWAVIWNNPDECTTGGFAGGQCGEGDLGNVDAGFSLARLAGHVVGKNGVANFGGEIPLPGSSDILIGDGLTNPLGAEVHFVLRYHGPIIPGHVNDQILTGGGGCSPESLVGTPFTGGIDGGYDCVDTQFAIHP